MSGTDYSSDRPYEPWNYEKQDKAAHKMTQPTPPPRCRVPQQVGCENAQGTLNIHLESERCEVCERRVSGERRKLDVGCTLERDGYHHMRVHDVTRCPNERISDRRNAGKL